MTTPSCTRRSIRALVSFAFLPVALSLACGTAFATLGGDAASIDADQSAMQASSSSTSSATSTSPNLTIPRYAVRQLMLPAGTLIREYVSPSDKVFAVTWNGPFIPDLRQLLGPDHFAAFSAASPGNQSPGLVVRSMGRMRAFNGIAYLPAELPSGVTVDDIQ